MLDRRARPAAEVHDCELCRALLGLASSAVAVEAAERDERRATIHLVEERTDDEARR